MLQIFLDKILSTISTGDVTTSTGIILVNILICICYLGHGRLYRDVHAQAKDSYSYNFQTLFFYMVGGGMETPNHRS